MIAVVNNDVGRMIIQLVSPDDIICGTVSCICSKDFNPQEIFIDPIVFNQWKGTVEQTYADISVICYQIVPDWQKICSYCPDCNSGLFD